MYNNNSPLPVLRNSLIWGNTAATGPNIDNSTSTPSFAYSIVEGSFGGGLSWDNSAGTEAVPGSNLDTDPLFLDWQDPGTVTMPNSAGDYRPKDGSGGVEGSIQSPAIDGGDSTRYPANADDPVFSGITLSQAAKALINEALEKDLSGAPRVQGSNIDMGAYERR